MTGASLVASMTLPSELASELVTISPPHAAVVATPARMAARITRPRVGAVLGVARATEPQNGHVASDDRT